MPISKTAFVAHVPGHKNSKGEAAPWVIKSHEDGHIISSHKTKAEAKEHLRQMHAHSAASHKFSSESSQYDYEANGNDVILISPSNQTKLLEGDAAKSFWVSLDAIEERTLEGSQDEYNKQVQNLISTLFDRETKIAHYLIEVDASKANKKATKPMYVSGAGYKAGRIEKLKFTGNPKKALLLPRLAANSVRMQLPEFQITGRLKEADSHLEEIKEADYGQEVIVDVHDVPVEFFNKKSVRQFTEQLCDEIGMKRGPNHMWGDDNELGTKDNPKVDGLSCVQFLYSSSITIHALDELQKVFLNVFSCKTFDSEKVKQLVEQKIGGRIVSFHDFKRV
jgi:S-adenosylmethionine/arginine decarboxylase-like enzyme